MSNNLETSMAAVGLRADGLLEYRYKSGVSVSLANAQEAIGKAQEFIDQPQPTLVLMADVRQVDREARTFFASAPENLMVSSQVAPVRRVTY